MAGLSEEDDRIVRSIVSAKDFRWWFDKVKVPAARKSVIEQTGIKISAKKFTEMIEELCEWYRKKRRHHSSKTMLDAAEWERLQFEVVSWGEFLADKTIEEAALIVSTEVPCNKQQLMGLTKKFHLWKKSSFVIG